MRILITGSRDWADEQFIYDTLRDVDWEFGLGGGRATVVHGGARGADRIAERAGHFRGWQAEVHHADWQTHGKRAGFLRNAEMVRAGADLCLAFIRNGSRGATMCANLAEQAGIEVRRFEVSG